MKTITSFFSRLTAKEPLPEQPDESDHECIVVASRKAPEERSSVKPASRKRPRAPLAERNIAQVQNKRRRLVSHVEIPARPARFASKVTGSHRSPRQAMIPSARQPQSDLAYDSDEGPLALLASDKGKVLIESGSSSQRGTEISAKERPSSWSAFASATGYSLRDEVATGTSRPRKAKHRQSYAIAEASDGSEDDLARGHETISRKPRVPAKCRQDDSNFEEDTHVSPASEDEDFDDGASDESSEVASKPALSDDEPVKSRKLKDSAIQSLIPKTKLKAQKASADDMKRLLKRPTGVVKGLDHTLPPLHEIGDIFEDITARALKMGLQDAIAHLKARPLRVATMCSGTESPILAMQMVSDCLKLTGQESFEVEHVFSAEIVPFKQAYIERNFAPPVTFRNIVEFKTAFDSDKPLATTAYGAKVPIPMDVDVVIAGTSCVDYSPLNNKKKGMSDQGESGLTWHGALAYCKEARPAIIIFENVVSADWASMLKHYRDIGYDCKGVIVDTKDYYIPQTRQRGYMVCFDTSKESAHTKGSSILGSQWQSLMENFRRLSSSPVSSFLVPNDQVVRRLQTRDDDAVREVDWSKCEITQMEYRSKKRLGSARPFTQWAESGTMSVPDNSSPAWYRRQVERVLDTIDCSVLRKALVGYDARYKTRIWDLSQNIYRSTDHQPFGIAGCITPDGIVFISDVGRVMSAEETLKLQGIPLDRISFTTETSNDQQDLAGNAMTSTVVGSALIAALITGHRLVNTRNSTSGVTSKPRHFSQPSAERLTPGLLQRIVYESSHGGCKRSAISEPARKAMRMCYCEGSAGLVSKPLQICVDCGHTTHVSCGGNPRHSYIPLVQDRQRPIEFEQELKAMLPLHLSFEGDADRSDIQALVANAGDSAHRRKDYTIAVEHALAHDFSISNIRRTHCWTASYVSKHARLDLVIEKKSLEWRLYGIAPTHLASDDWLRMQLQQPIAKAIIQSSLFDVEWHWRRPTEMQLPMTCEGRGAKVPTWWARNGMPDYRNDQQSEKLEIMVSAAEMLQLNGTYHSLPKCGKACDSLYKKVAQDRHEKPIWLFLDPSRTGDPDEDEFVFSHSNELLEYDEVRPIIAKVKAPWRPWLKSKHHGPSVKPALLVDAEWKPAFPRMRLEARMKRLELAVSRLAPTGVKCTTTPLMIKCEVETNDLLLKPNKKLNRAFDARFLSDNAWIIEVFRRHLQARDWQVLDLANREECVSCAPPRPQLRWRLVKNALQPYEDPASAAVYEKAVKSRPAPFVLRVNEATEGKSLIEFGVNTATLAHLAMARLPPALRPKAAVKWRLDTADASGSLTQYPKFQLRDTRDLTPYSGPLEMSVELFTKQRLSLAWMRSQEKGVKFNLEESEEARLPVHGWRAEAQASVPITIRGGICADHPGFGKTITSLALVQAQFLSSSPAAVRKELQTRSMGLLASSATLIICPATLLKQWLEEIEDKARYREGVIAIDRVSDLAKFTVNQVETAKIIVVNRSIFAKDDYAERLAAFAGMPGPATKSGRAFAHWLEHAHAQVPEHVEIMQHKSLRDLKDHVSCKYRARMQSDEYKAAVPSRRLRGQNLAKQKSSDSTYTKPASTVLDTTGIEKPLFEMFYFNRIIVDEFHNYEPREYAAILALKSDKRWGLSATPAMDDFYDISRTAALIGVTLRYGCDAKGIMKAKNRQTLQSDMTSFELFDSMRQVPSQALHDRIWELDQAFLDTFVRRNVMNYGEMVYHDHIMPVNLDLAHRVKYSQLSQQLNSLDMRLKKGRKKEATDLDNRIYKATAFAESAEEVLTQTAAFYEHDTKDHDPITALSTECSTEHSKLTQKLSGLLLEAAGKEPDALASWIGTRLDSATLGDAEAVQAVRSLISLLPKHGLASIVTAAAKLKAAKASSSKEESASKNTVVTKLNTTAKGLLRVTRSLRYIRQVQEVQEAAKASRNASICQHAECNKGNAEVAVSAFCGHSICKTCHHRLEAQHNNSCPVPGCQAEMHPHHLLWASKMGDFHKTDVAPYGAKIEAAMDLLEEIQRKGDQAILFVQYANQLEEVEQALEDRNIPATVVKDTKYAGSQIAKFRTSTESTVIVLNASDETAAGSNLQNANHVLFLSPLLRDTQYSYEATMAQAIGRVRRHGQKKQIFVYRFVALDTIDVDILEHREKRTDALVERGAPKVKPPTALKKAGKEEPKAERTQLVREHGRFSLRPQSWLVSDEKAGDGTAKVKGKSRVLGWEDFSSLVKFSGAYTEDDD